MLVVDAFEGECHRKNVERYLDVARANFKKLEVCVALGAFGNSNLAQEVRGFVKAVYGRDFDFGGQDVFEAIEVMNRDRRGATGAQVKLVCEALDHVVHDEGADSECRNDIDSLFVEKDAVEFPA